MTIPTAGAIPAASPTATTPPAPARVVVVGTAGGEGASTVVQLLALLLAEHGAPPEVIARPDDVTDLPVAAHARRAATSIVDAGPHGLDGTVREGESVVLVCAATQDAIGRARAVLEADEPRRRVDALVVVARSAREARRGLAVTTRTSRDDDRVVALPYDRALRVAGRIDRDGLAPATWAAVGRALGLVSDRAPQAPLPGHGPSIGTEPPRVS